MYKYHLSLGSNIEPRLKHMQQAVQYLEDTGEIIAKSSIFRTSPWGFTDQPEFYNAIIRYYSIHAPKQLLNNIKRIEKKIGRGSGQRWGPRVIDIDIIWCDLISVNNEELAIPHPRFRDRRFVLEPLREITDNLYLSNKKMPVAELLLNCADQSEVKKIEMTW